MTDRPERLKTSYDKSTDSLYVELRPIPSFRTVEIEEDIMLDIGSDGEPVGYDIQHASTKAEFIGRLILEKSPPCRRVNCRGALA